MTPQFFTTQMLRLKSEWANSFGPERQAALWDIYKAEPDDVFSGAVTRLILNGTAYPPKLKDFEFEVNLARGRWKERQWDRSQGITPGAQPDTTATPDVRERVHEMVQSIVHRPPPDPTKNTEDRKDELRAQLKIISGRDRAAGEGRDDS